MEMIEDRGQIGGFKVVLLVPVIAIIQSLLLKLLYSLPLSDSLLWSFGVFLYFYVPGNLLLRILKSEGNDHVIRLFHSVALGTALTPLIYSVLRIISPPGLIYLFGILIFPVWVFCVFRDLKKGLKISTTHQDIFYIAGIYVIIFVLLHFSHFTDVILFEDGFKLRISNLTESIYHLGIINVLKDTFPPFFPYASGHTFSFYHLNMHLEIEMFSRLFSIDSLKLTYFYFPLLYFFLLSFVPYMFVRNHWDSRLLGFFTAILMFGADFSFIPGLLDLTPHGVPWTSLFGESIWSLFTLNGILPALFVTFLCFFYLKLFFGTGKLRHLAVSVFLVYSAYGFKSSIGPHILVAAFMTAITLFFIKDKKKGLLLFAASAFATLLIAIDMILIRGGTGNNVISIDLFNNFYSVLNKFDRTSIPWYAYFAVFPAYVIAAFGVRFLGFYFLKNALQKKIVDPIIVFLIFFIISGFLMPEIIYISNSPMDKNNASFFSAASLMVAWFLLAFFMISLKNSRKKYFWISFFILIFLSFPGTVQFLNMRFDSSYSTVGRSEIEIVKYLQATPRESVILSPPNYSWPSLASNFAGRQSVINFFRSFPAGTIGEEETINRFYAVESFFSLNNPNRSSFMKKYKVDYIYAPLIYQIILDSEPMLRFEAINSGYVVYKVHNDGIFSQ
jgi:hypothetical protein